MTVHEPSQAGASRRGALGWAVTACAFWLVGCALDRTASRASGLSPEDYRQNYPRQYFNSLDSMSDRRHADYLFHEEERR